MDKHKSKLPTMKTPRITKEAQKKEYNIKKSEIISSTLEWSKIPNPLEYAGMGCPQNS